MKKILFLILFIFLLVSADGQPLIVYNNSLVYRCLDTTDYIFRLGKYNEDTAMLYPNPDSGYGYYGDPVIHDNKLYFRYKNGLQYFLACFNGNAINFVPLPDKVKYQGSPIIYQNILLGNFKYLVSDSGSVTLGDKTVTESGYNGSPIIFNSNLYFVYNDSKGDNFLAKYNGLNTMLYDNPDSGKGCVGYNVIHNDKLFFRYYNASSRFQLAKLDGNTIELISNPDNALGFDGCPIVFKNYLYVRYYGNNNRVYLAKNEGSGLTLMPNPDIGMGYSYQSKPVILSTNLFFGYNDQAGRCRIARFDGTSISLLPNPDSGYGYYGAIQLYNGNLYFGYRDSKNMPRLARCNGNTISLFANPDTGMGYRGHPLVYNNKLYFMYANAALKLQLAQCDGDSIRLIPNTFMGSAIPVPPPTESDVGPYTQSLSNITEMKTAVPFEMVAAAYVYPNPASSMLKIFSTQFPATIQIIDISGRLVLQTTAYSQETSVTISGLKEGVYLVSVETESTTTIKKFIKK